MCLAISHCFIPVVLLADLSFSLAHATSMPTPAALSQRLPAHVTLLAVQVEGEWREYEGDGGGRNERPGDRAARTAGVVHQVPGRVGDVADGVELDEGLKPAGHGARLDEDVAGERERHERDVGDAYDDGGV